MAIHRYCLSFICLGVLPDFRQRFLPQPLTAASLESFAFGLGANDLFFKKEKEFLAIDVVGGKLCGKRGKRAKVRGIERPQAPRFPCGRFARLFHEEKRGESYQQES